MGNGVSNMKNSNFSSFIEDMMRFASSADSPDNIINSLLKYICENLKSDRAYIFEENPTGGYDNTYEYCREGVSAEIDNLQNVPYENLIEVWFTEYKKSRNILIYDLEEYRKTSEAVYQILKPQGVSTLVTGPIEINGKYIGFYGVDNPPAEIMETVSELIDMMDFIISMMIRIRDYTRAVENSSLTDVLTGCRNRKALDWAYEGMYRKDIPISVLMCDLNGLKYKNDTEGHKAGDRYLCDAADALRECFGSKNVYRIGGDEFVVVRFSDTYDEIMQIKKDFEKLCIKKEISFAVGIEYYESAEESFEAVLQKADQKMYEEKRSFYENSGKDRRRRNQIQTFMKAQHWIEK